MLGTLGAILFFIIVVVAIWALFQPLLLTVAAAAEGLSVELTVQAKYSRIHKTRTWSLPVIPSHQAKKSGGPALQLNPALIDEAIWAYRVLNRITDQLWHRMQIVNFDLYAEVGLGDAAQTALWMGRVTQWTAWWIGIRVGPRAMKPPHWTVIPVWEESVFRGNFSSIIQLLPSDIMLAILYGLLGHPKGGHHRYGQSVQHQHA